MRANNRNKTQQSVKKKAKIVAQQRKRRIKTTTGNTASTAQFVSSATQNRKRNPPDQQTKATAVRSTPATTKQTKTDANKNIVRQSQHTSAPAVARSCSVRRQIRSRTVGIHSPRKEAHRPAAPVDDPTNQAEKNSRTNHTNKQTRRNTSPAQYASAQKRIVLQNTNTRLA